MVQQHEDWARFPGEHFSDGELLLGDNEMHYSDVVMGPHKGQREQTVTNKNCDWQLAHHHVISEHTFGILKGRWASLKELRIPTGSEADFISAMEWVLALCVLHNVCHSMNDGDVEPSPALPAVEEPLPAHPRAEETRSRVKRDVTAVMKTTGTYRYLLQWDRCVSLYAPSVTRNSRSHGPTPYHTNNKEL